MSRKILIDDDAAQYESIMQRLRRLEQGLPEDVTYIGFSFELLFLNSWQNYETPNPPNTRSAGFYRDRGRVYLTGVIKSGTSGTAAFTLPEGYWPRSTINCELIAVASGGPARLQVSNDGDVTPIDLSSSAVATYISLEGVSFLHR